MYWRVAAGGTGDYILVVLERWPLATVLLLLQLLLVCTMLQLQLLPMCTML